MTWIATEGYGLYPAPETLGFVPMLGTPTETRICSPTWRQANVPTIRNAIRIVGARSAYAGLPSKNYRQAAVTRRRVVAAGLDERGIPATCGGKWSAPPTL